MPPTGANTKVKDPEYCNWLKVGLALYYLKDGLSSFIQDEVDAMHKFILQKLYNATTVPAQLCSSCDAKDVKQNRNGYTWKFKSRCPISLCDTWLTELLALCTNPTSSKLYCENCDVTAWPKSPWECAKFYMPRGQTVNNTGPAQSDSQALLTLMANCKHFHSKLSPGGIQLTHTVSKIRNTVMHSGDMKLSDNERTSFITDIIKLLEDPCHLISLDECKKAVAEINKINTDSLEVFFNTDIEAEMKALSACVKEFRQELGVHTIETEKTVESLKEELKDHQKQLEDMQKNVNLLKRKNRVIFSQQKNKVKKLEKMGTELKQFSKTVTSDLKVVKREVRKQSASCSVVKKTVNLFKRKTLTGLSQQKKKVRKLEKEMQLTKGCDSQASRATVGQVSKMIMESDVQDIQKLFINAYKGVQIISVNAVLDNAVYWKDLEDFYTDIVIEEEEESAQRIKNDQQLKKVVTSFRQIFEKCNEKVTRIILQAPAGQGKSTFCRKLVRTWCSVRMKRLYNPFDDKTSYRSETSGLKHEDEMLRFDVLLYICLRDISDEKTLMDVVHAQFPLGETQGHMSHIEALIGQAENNKVLLIMDGLDEMDNSLSFIGKVMRRELYPNLTVLATTRSWKISELRLIISAHIDLLLDLQGFSFENSMLFAKRMFDKYYNDDSAIVQFKEDILKNDVIKSLIHVPLLLLFIVQVWYDRKSFPQTIHELYLEMLDVIVNRYLKGKKRIAKNQGKQDQKWTLGSTSFNANQKLSKLSLVKHLGADFLAALGEVANHFLMKACQENSLVFDEDVLLELFGKEGTAKLLTALDLGILSKSESRGTFCEKIRLTFLHKTVQEFLAAINICCREDRCNMFLDSLKTFDNVLENEQIIKFAAGISTTRCQEIFEKMYEICDKGRLSVYQMNSLIRIYIDCISETRKETLCLKLYCIYAANQNIWNELQSAMKNTLKVRIHLKYLHLESCILNDAELDFFEFQHLMKFKLRRVTVNGNLLLSKCTHLKCLDLDSCTLDDVVLDLSQSICLEDIELNNVIMKGKLLLSKCTHLKHLNLSNCILDSCVLDLSEFIFLEDIRLTNVTMKGKLLLSKCTDLVCLNLFNCTLDDVTLDLSECTCLAKFLCYKMTLTGRGRLLCTQLEELKFVRSNLGDVILDMSNCPINQIPLLQNASVVDADLIDALLGSKNVNICTKLTIDNVTMNTECKKVFYNSLSQCKELKELSIKHMDLGDGLLCLHNLEKFELLNNLNMSLDCVDHIKSSEVCQLSMKGKLLPSKFTHLKYLKLINCKLADYVLDLSESICLEDIRLTDVTMKGKLLLSKCTHLKCLNLDNCTLDDDVLDLSESICLEYIRLIHVTKKSKVLLSKCSNLKRLLMNTCNLDGYVLDLSESICLEDLRLINVTAKGKLLLSKCTHLNYLNLASCILEFTVFECTCVESFFCNNVTLTGRSRLLCTRVKYLILVNCNLGECTLNLSPCPIKQIPQLQNTPMENAYLKDELLSPDNVNTCTQLTIDNVTMSKECKEVFYNSLSQCKDLYYLLIQNVDLGDALLSFDSENNIWDFNLDNVTMSKECIEVFCKSLSQCKNIERLSIKNVDLYDARLSLVNVNYVYLDNVTMSKECKEAFCNSLSQCKDLRELSIKNVELCDALLNRVSVKYVNLENVTMSKECKEVFCNSLSQCKELERLSIKNVDLCDALLNLVSVKYVNLENVTMSKKCKEVFCNSLSQCKELEELLIKNMDLCDAHLSLDSLNYVYLDNVTMSKECKEVFCNSLSQCKDLRELSIKNLDLWNALRSFNSESYLRGLALDNVTMSKECKEVFCNSLSQCKELVRLSIKNVDLCDGLHELYNMKRLNYVTLESVKMGTLGKVMMCKSLCQCTQLKYLTLKNLDLGDGLLSLNSLGILRSLTLDNVTMCKDGYLMLCSSISTCKSLKLSLKNLDLGDGLLCLDNLEKFELVNITMSLESVDYIKSSQQCQLSSCFRTDLSIEMIANSCDKFAVNYALKRDDTDLHDFDQDDYDFDPDDYNDDLDDDDLDEFDLDVFFGQLI